ncbi:MAG: oxidase, partial [Deltaproteobacteria bacterium]
SGMKKNRYGNIEDLVLDIRAVGAQGMMSRSGVAPRESIGLDPARQWFGSEGNLGIITSAVVKLFDLPPVHTYGSIIFPSFEEGVAFMYELSQLHTWPASVRLVDNMQFQFSMALKPEKSGAKRLLSRLEKLYVTGLRGFVPDKMTACTLVFEGSAEEVAVQEQQVYKIAALHGGLKAGAENGKRGYQLTYGIAYIRDFVMKHHVLAESFETSVPWSRVLELCERVKQRLYREHAARGLPGKPFITCRVTQLYQTGVCVYFYFAFYAKGVANPSQVYSDIEAAARTEILQSGGSLSHHHGVGKLRKRFLPEIMSEACLDWATRSKHAVDPDNVFGCGNLN